jgi:hypothetical protein
VFFRKAAILTFPESGVLKNRERETVESARLIVLQD